jgi:predicted kinase
MNIYLPKRSIVVLSGAAGSGKTTFARRFFAPSQILSSDFCRKLIADRVDWSPHLSPAAFRVLHTILEERLRLGKLTVIDSTAVLAVHRAIYLKIARRFNVRSALIVLDIPDKVCIERDRRRSQPVGHGAITTQWELLQQGLEKVHEEGFGSVHILNERNQFNSNIIIGDPRKDIQTPKTIIESPVSIPSPAAPTNGRSLNGKSKNSKTKTTSPLRQSKSKSSR